MGAGAGTGVILTPDLAGCVSTVLSEADVDSMLAAADRSFALIERE